MPSLGRMMTVMALGATVLAGPISKRCDSSSTIAPVSTAAPTSSVPPVIPSTTVPPVTSAEPTTTDDGGVHGPGPVAPQSQDPTTTVPPVTSAEPTTTDAPPNTTTDDGGVHGPGPVAPQSQDPTTVLNPVPVPPVTTPAPVPTTTSAATAPSATANVDPNLVCNGDSRLCSRKYSDIVHIGAHDSYAVTGSGGIPGISDVASDQSIDIPSQLNMGIRFLQSQTHLKDNEIHVCHTNCELYDGGALVDYLKNVNSFMTDPKNAGEVVTLLITNGDNIPLDQFQQAFNQSGLESMVFKPSSVPDTRDAWPTLGDMITSNQRIVSIMDYNADTTKLPYMLPEFDMMWETPFDTTDSSFACKVDRVSGDPAPKLGLINHYLDKSIFGLLIPDSPAAKTTNSLDSITNEVNGCNALGNGYKITHVLMDWINVGDAVAAGRSLNGLS